LSNLFPLQRNFLTPHRYEILQPSGNSSRFSSSFTMVDETEETLDERDVSVSGILVDEIAEPSNKLLPSNSLGLVDGVTGFPLRRAVLPSDSLTSTGVIVEPLVKRGSLVFVLVGGELEWPSDERDGTESDFLVFGGEGPSVKQGGFVLVAGTTGPAGKRDVSSSVFVVGGTGSSVRGDSGTSGLSVGEMSILLVGVTESLSDKLGSSAFVVLVGEAVRVLGALGIGKEACVCDPRCPR
jgi:hypothetical protein